MLSALLNVFRRLLLVLVVPALIVSSVGALPTAMAAPRDPPAAEVLFQQGRSALARKEYRVACAKFAESQRLEPAAGTLMNWATCLEKQQKLASAWQRWTEALNRLLPGDDRIAFVSARIESLKKRMPRLTIRLEANAPQETQVYRDNVLLREPSHGTALPVNPGRHVIRAVAPEHKDTTLSIVLREGDRRVVRIGPGDRLERSETKTAESTSLPRTLGFVAAGVGAAGITTGLITGVMLNETRETVQNNCIDKQCNTEGLDAAERGKTLLTVNTAAWGAGIVGAVVGAVLLITAPSSKERPPAAHALSFQPRRGGAQLDYQVGF